MTSSPGSSHWIYCTKRGFSSQTRQAWAAKAVSGHGWAQAEAAPRGNAGTCSGFKSWSYLNRVKFLETNPSSPSDALMWGSTPQKCSISSHKSFLGLGFDGVRPSGITEHGIVEYSELGGTHKDLSPCTGDLKIPPCAWECCLNIPGALAALGMSAFPEEPSQCPSTLWRKNFPQYSTWASHSASCHSLESCHGWICNIPD